MITNAIRIPTSFYIFGVEIKVVYKEAYLAHNGRNGEADYQNNTITLTTSADGLNPMPQCKLEHIFFHELMHHVLEITGWQERLLKEHETKEHFVDTVAGALHQAFKTMQFDENTKKG